MNTALICIAANGHGTGVLWFDISVCCIYVLILIYLICVRLSYNNKGPISWIKNYIDKRKSKKKEKESGLVHKKIVDKTNKLL